MTPKNEAEMIKLLQAIAAGVGSILSELRGRRAPGPAETASVPAIPMTILVPVCPACGRPLVGPTGNFR